MLFSTFYFSYEIKTAEIWQYKYQLVNNFFWNRNDLERHFEFEFLSFSSIIIYYRSMRWVESGSDNQLNSIGYYQKYIRIIIKILDNFSSNLYVLRPFAANFTYRHMQLRSDFEMMIMILFLKFPWIGSLTFFTKSLTWEDSNFKCLGTSCCQIVFWSWK